ncbi:hypothetical protein QTP70_029523 [Hemibagrus guttatus]|uniref:CCHC-type domain-containing protein n=1 Tax=Hemibagrus guttatus TaxID=175788 RepID=A0AAE0PSU8_9TELE|nr:hypothetical protein QTP70_029523 [Hemibagrus guttatus]
MLAYKANKGPAPSYLKALITPRTAPRSLRSTTTARLIPPSLRVKAEYVHLQVVRARQGAHNLICAYQKQLAALQSAHELQQQSPPAQITSLAAAAPARSELVRMALPEKFDGSADGCHGDNFFAHQPDVYLEETKWAFLQSLLTGRALNWASAVWDRDQQWLELRQDSFCEGLQPTLHVEMACWDTHTTLSKYITTAIHLDNLLCQQSHSPHLHAEPRLREEHQNPREEGTEPMKLGHAWVFYVERRGQAHLQLCFYCGGSGHQLSACPERSIMSKVRENHWSSCFTLQVTLHYDQDSVVVSALVDSGEAVNLIDYHLVEELCLYPALQDSPASDGC